MVVAGARLATAETQAGKPALPADMDGAGTALALIVNRHGIRALNSRQI